LEICQRAARYAMDFLDAGFVEESVHDMGENVRINKWQPNATNQYKIICFCADTFISPILHASMVESEIYLSLLPSYPR
jgi:hypothetical protein